MENVDQVKQITEDLLKRLDVSGEVVVDVDETGAYRAHIETEETGLLIGFHGKTLESFQIILGLLVSKALKEWVRVYVNVGDYREKREESLMLMAQHAAERAMAAGRPIEIPNLSASERRIIHLTLAGDDRVETESVGEGSRRLLLVKPKSM
ncbi:MAG: Single-stranded nucleic acid binding R3H domain protein [Candidatus Gottesmanbacteria bacterium GW2011_GWB1_49_7]|uniref:Single-stranded nucleic acid binding R3H domain protein n=1 Tax=Candidatus Gottesmanbacteria bacterium GW2011_GWB1_49_7 TaxID=1618448 RepID=A0A0G1VWP1_9BACT|nr:MAG: single-stranded nucleic acid binding R3H domain-containing protein, spoIIIJ-associated protein [Microgenomates group bacterium GW2011_GWC1_49_7]KKW10893.1 MAG: Single-stranded nucleic acid binding R3H domain protein [Candidatus Gottesmanbacteria bacterium GW2011_GWB1_49_7]